MSRTLSDTNSNPDLALEQEAIVPSRASRTAVQSGAQVPPPKSNLWFTNEMRIVWGVLLLYVLGFLCFYPRALTNSDEVAYVRQAVSLASGSATVDAVDPFTGQHHRVHPSDYPAGTSSLMVPFVWLAGWRGTFLLGLLALLGCHAIHGALDRRFGRLAALRSGRARLSTGHGDGSHWHERSSQRLPGGSRTVAVLGETIQALPGGGWRRVSWRGCPFVFGSPISHSLRSSSRGRCCGVSAISAPLILGGLGRRGVPAFSSPPWSTETRFLSRITSMVSRVISLEKTW